MSTTELRARVIKEGHAKARALVSDAPISFFGGVDLDAGRIRESGHPLDGRSLAGKVLVFPTGKGSTVGSYAIYRLAKAGLAPAALVMENCEAIVATGAILAGIPCVDRVDISKFATGDMVEIEGARVLVASVGQGDDAPQEGRGFGPDEGAR